MTLTMWWCVTERQPIQRLRLPKDTARAYFLKMPCASNRAASKISRAYVPAVSIIQRMIGFFLLIPMKRRPTDWCKKFESLWKRPKNRGLMYMKFRFDILARTGGRFSTHRIIRDISAYSLPKNLARIFTNRPIREFGSERNRMQRCVLRI